MSVITLDPRSTEPKYQQIINSILLAIDNNQLRIGDKIASVNEVSEQTGIAKKTVVQAFDRLKESGVISSVKYKGYFIASRETKMQHNIFTLFNELTVYKEDIYESMKQRLEGKGSVDLYFHHERTEIFKALIEKSAGRYTEYIIIPPIDDNVFNESLARLPKDKVYILDLGYKEWGKKFPSVCQYFEEDIYTGLTSGLQKIRKYKKLVLVLGIYPRYKINYYKAGFRRFCEQYGFDNAVIMSFKQYPPAEGELYITLHDHDLIEFIKMSKGSGLQMGQNVGVISYNEIPLKEVIGNGISTMTTDFSEMGRNVIDMILSKRKHQIRNPFRLIDRGSF